ncbi:MAG: hypothetical protein K6E74_04305 [Bacilli bacterium]|nr:hypothetical protein [Bacilli bacterium]
MENTKQMNPTVKKVLSIVFNVLFYAFLVLLFVFAISNIRSKKNNIPNIFGVGYLQVQTGSMTGTFEAGDVIWVKVANEKKVEKLKIGDVITFYDAAIAESISEAGGEDDGTYLNTHRIVDIKDMADGSKRYICQGDYVKKSHPDAVYDSTKDTNTLIQIVKAEDIKAVYIKNMGKGMTGLLKFAKSSLGFGLCIVLPTALLLVYEVVMLIRNLMTLNKEKIEAKMAEDKAAQQEDLELQKQRMREELLAELRDEQAKGEEAKEEQVEEEKPAEEEKEPEEENKEE